MPSPDPKRFNQSYPIGDIGAFSYPAYLLIWYLLTASWVPYGHWSIAQPATALMADACPMTVDPEEVVDHKPTWYRLT